MKRKNGVKLHPSNQYDKGEKVMNGFYDLAEENTSKAVEDKSTGEESGKLQELLEETREQNQMMEQLIRNQIAVKDQMIDKLHDELDYYKRDAADKFTDQLMKAVIKIRRDMVKRILEKRWDDISLDDLKREYQYVFEDLTDLLEQQNVDAYESEPGDDFDPAIHQPKLEMTAEKILEQKDHEKHQRGIQKRQ